MISHRQKKAFRDQPVTRSAAGVVDTIVLDME
jgi:hypothetical protein